MDGQARQATYRLQRPRTVTSQKPGGLCEHQTTMLSTSLTLRPRPSQEGSRARVGGSGGGKWTFMVKEASLMPSLRAGGGTQPMRCWRTLREGHSAGAAAEEGARHKTSSQIHTRALSRSFHRGATIKSITSRPTRGKLGRNLYSPSKHMIELRQRSWRCSITA